MVPDTTNTRRGSRSKGSRSNDQPVPQDVHRLPGHLIRRAQQAHNRLWVNEVSAEVTSPQYGILNAILASPGIDQKTVGEEVGIDKSTVGDVVNRLIERKLVVMYRGVEDQRRNLLYLTKAGSLVVADIAPRVLDMNRKLVAALDEPEIERLVSILEKLIASVEENGSGS